MYSGLMTSYLYMFIEEIAARVLRKTVNDTCIDFNFYA